MALALGKTEKLENLTLIGFVFLKDKIRKNVKKIRKKKLQKMLNFLQGKLKRKI